MSDHARQKREQASKTASKQTSTQESKQTSKQTNKTRKKESKQEHPTPPHLSQRVRAVHVMLEFSAQLQTPVRHVPRVRLHRFGGQRSEEVNGRQRVVQIAQRVHEGGVPTPPQWQTPHHSGKHHTTPHHTVPSHHSTTPHHTTPHHSTPQ